MQPKNFIYVVQPGELVQEDQVETSMCLEIVTFALLSEKELKRVEARFNTSEEELLM